MLLGTAGDPSRSLGWGASGLWRSPEAPEHLGNRGYCQGSGELGDFPGTSTLSKSLNHIQLLPGYRHHLPMLRLLLATMGLHLALGAQ